MVSFKDIQILNDEFGKPFIKLSRPMNYKFHISLSDEKNYATSFVIIEEA
jgi:phosphopantetheinyl transferase (holo-ACP synthase)